MSSTIYSEAGIENVALNGLNEAMRRLTVAANVIRDLKTPAPIPSPEPPTIPESPRYNEFWVGRRYDSYPFGLVWRSVKDIDHDASKMILSTLWPVELVTFTRQVEEFAATIEKLASEHQTRVSEAVREALASEDEAIRQLAERVTEQQRRERKKEEADAAYVADRAAWIDEHGSERLRRCVAEGIDCDVAYIDERLTAERPGWAYYGDTRGSATAFSDPPLDAFQVLDAARALEAKAKLSYFVTPHEHTSQCYDMDRGCPLSEDECPKNDWEGYVALSTFLSGTIVFGVPSGM